MPTLTDDLQAVLNLKATHFKGKTYAAWSDTDLAAYQQTRTLPEKKRAAAVLEQWDGYLNDHLAPLVREAVPEAINLSKQTCSNSVSERKCFVESCISDWIIGPASGHTRWWFMAACEGSSVVMDAARTKGPTWKESIDAWALPHWLNPYSKLEDGATLFIRDRQNVLRERLQYVSREEIGAMADRLLMPAPVHSAAAVPAAGQSAPEVEVFSSWTPRQQCVGRILERQQSKMTCAELRLAMKNSGFKYEPMSRMFRDTVLVGGPSDTTPIVKVEEKAFCLRRFFQP